MKDRWRVSRSYSAVGCYGAVTAGLAAFALGAAFLAPIVRADDAGPGAARAVRLSSVEGKVQVSQGGQVLADPALANMPLFEGARISTAGDGRAEIQFEDGSIARLSPNSSLTLSVLRGQNNTAETEIQMESGLAYFELQEASAPGQTRIRFGSSVVTATGFTVVRVDLDTPPGDMAVFTGNAHLERAGGGASIDAHGGQSVTLNGADPGQFKLADSIQPDSWDAWNADRDQALQTEYSSQTPATRSQPDSNNPGWADLDANGNWYNVPDQGYVWSPTDASNPGWDPYGNGNWMYTPSYGYIFVSGNPWGYMPYQCGAWNFYDSFGWGWMPGMGCSPWWIGGMGWYPNIGRGPRGYLPPRRPIVGPGGARGFVGGQTIAGARLPAYAVIPVSRSLTGSSAILPARDRSVPAVIAGRQVRAESPVSARPAYEGVHSGFAYRGAPRAAASIAGFNSAHPFNANSSHPYSPPASRPSSSSRTSGGSGSSLGNGGGSRAGGGGYGGGGGGGARGGGGGHR